MSTAVTAPIAGSPSNALRPPRRPWPWFLWLAFFYSGWLSILLAGDHLDAALRHWPIALAMSAGSYVAGSTPMGGGTVGFPILVLLFEMPASLGRNFSFAVQSVGMTSASIFILSTGKPFAKRVLLWAMAGSLVGTPLGAALVAPHANDLFVKLLFAVIWASFGVMTLVRVREMARYEGMTRVSAALERRIGLFTGLFGGALIASLTGVGIDMLIYTLLVLVLRADLKIAIPTSVMIMAWTSLVGLASNVALGAVQTEVWLNWLAAAPIVALGAPLGVFVVNRIGRTPTLIFVALLCIGQFVWTIVNERVGVYVAALAVAGVLVANLAYHLLYIAGGHLAHRRVEERIL